MKSPGQVGETVEFPRLRGQQHLSAGLAEPGNSAPVASSHLVGDERGREVPEWGCGKRSDLSEFRQNIEVEIATFVDQLADAPEASPDRQSRDFSVGRFDNF